MWLKPAIVILFIALCISLFSGLVMLSKDQGGSRRTWWALMIRLSLATTMMGLIIYGIYTGQLGSNAPWDRDRYGGERGDAVSAPPAEETSR